jgi:5'-nucleotidase
MNSSPHSRRRQFGLRSLLIPVAVAAVAVAPLAVESAKPANAARFGGAATINDPLVVRYPGAGSGPTTDIHVLGFNDFHGALDPDLTGAQYGTPAGGAPFLAKLVKDRQAAYGANVATVMAGDHIGATPLVSALFFDEPAVLVGRHLGIDYASVGNHEFDKGKAELLRIQTGGCKVPEGCTAAPYTLPGGSTTPTWPGAGFQYLSANVIDTGTSAPLLPAYGIKSFTNGSAGTTKVGFIGLVLKDTPSIVTPSGVAGLNFLDETVAANNAATALKAAGAQTIVMVIHQGGFQTGSAALNGCAGNLAGSAINTIVSAGLDPAIGVIVSGHTHAEYRCTITTGGTTRVVTSASSNGRVVSDVTLSIYDNTGELLSAAATNTIVANGRTTAGTPPVASYNTALADPTVSGIVSQYKTAVAPLANAVKGRITADITTAATSFGESALGDVIADSQLAATAPAVKGGAVIAFMNPGGIRTNLTATQISGGEAVGEITYGEMFTVQPFGNTVTTKTMTGAMLRSLLEQQFVGCGGQTVQRILQISNGFQYEQAATATPCSAKIGKVKLNGVVINPTDSFRVTMNNFLASGGDGFTVFNQGTDQLGGDIDIDAMFAYFDTNKDGSYTAADSAIAPGPRNRIVAFAPEPVVPETPFPVLLVISSMLLIGGAALIVLRSRRGVAV